tara:strand:- start:255 stop:521 length:267 start_codon:yes stop_codon:yes gene_type:complete
MEEQKNKDNIAEIVLSEKEINKLISKFEKLKENKSSININLSKETELWIHHEEDELLKFKKEKRLHQKLLEGLNPRNLIKRFSKSEQK